VTIRRLNRAEYNNTIRDLVGIDFKPAADFPGDDVGYGFDNIGDVLSLSSLLLEKYLSAAEQIMERAVVIADPPQPQKRQLGRGGALRPSPKSAGDIRKPPRPPKPGQKPPTGFGVFLHSRGEIVLQNTFDEGDYTLGLLAYGQQVGEEPVKMALRINGQDVKEFLVKADESKPETYEAKLHLKAGQTRIGAAFLNPFTDPNNPDPEKNRRLLFVRGLEIDGPYNAPAPPLPDSHKRIMAHQAGMAQRQAAREIITRFANRAFRRPVKADEVDRLLALYDAAEGEGERFELRIRTALQGVLVSPHFLFRIELDPPGAKPQAAYFISEFELASRLSYFLWSSMPDEELFRLAEQGKLRNNLEPQVRRMLKDPKSVAFVQNFAGQWLTLRNLQTIAPDSKLFPSFNDELRSAMLRETELFFEAIMREDRSILDLLDADFSFLNETLAKHYGIDGVTGKEFQRVKLPATRGGLLTHASILTLTSNPTRTSPVKRGKWVLEQMLGTPPPLPPANVPDLEEDAKAQLSGSLRQRMEQHRANPNCATCHNKMDPLGFAFENFDAIGRWRTKDGTFDIDASGVLPDGQAFQGPAELKSILKSKKDLFGRCLAEKMLTYALGRGIEYYDKCALDDILKGLEKNDYRFSSLVLEIVKSEPFQKRMAK
jgi:Protein of unknown function (DUF1592)/Protein of unknown function (DUF1588)/Protein of unknown function (DUF1587)/Protein of unknown function (DUF1585)/Protein of unknown function (DUF1595)/Ca-dependent carbohydrate-binding module xylan-binding